MQTITKILVVLFLCGSPLSAVAQDTDNSQTNAERIEDLKEQIERVKTEERELLKAEVEAINKRLEKGEITKENAESLKKEAAQKHASNIEDRIAIINNKIALLERNSSDYRVESASNKFDISIGPNDDDDDDWSYIHISNKNKPKKYDRRTTCDLVFAIGFNNAIIEGQDIDDSPYKLGGSGFVELGWAWKTRLLQNSNAIRVKYGFSIIWNKLNIKDNMYFVREGDNIMLEEYPLRLDKAKFRTTQLVFPLHFEFGPSRKIERENYFRYTTRRQFKIGVGGYAGLTLATLQKLKYEVDGRDVKDKFKGGYNTTDFIYGISGYLAFGHTAVYVKYDLNTIFKNQEIDQNNISVGLRFDMD